MRPLGRDARRVVRWGPHERREQRGLGHGEVRRGLAEVAPRRGLDAVVALAEVHGVEVLLEDLRLRVSLLEACRDQDLANLAVVGPLRAQARGARELLRDRAAALDDAAGAEIAPGGTGDADRIDAVMRRRTDGPLPRAARRSCAAIPARAARRCDARRRTRTRACPARSCTRVDCARGAMAVIWPARSSSATIANVSAAAYPAAVHAAAAIATIPAVSKCRRIAAVQHSSNRSASVRTSRTRGFHAICAAASGCV